MNKRKLANKFVNIYVKPINWIIRKMNYHQRVQFETEFFKQIENEEAYSRISFLPKKLRYIGQKGQANRNFEKIAIVIQGAIDLQEDFTLETVKMCIEYYPNVRIIVSTWEDAYENVVKELQFLSGVTVIKNKYPALNGIGNINYQLTTSMAGVLLAKEYGAEYIWKIRSDQRYYNPFALNVLLKDCCKGKIVLLGGITNSHVNRPFHISDFMAFGHIEDMQLLYGCEMDEENTIDNKKYRKNQAEISEEFNNYIKEAEISESNPGRKVDSKFNNIPLKYANPEMLISYKYYINKSKDKIVKDYSIFEQYEDFLKNYVIIEDADSLGFFWDKYDHKAVQQSYFERRGKLDVARWKDIRG